MAHFQMIAVSLAFFAFLAFSLGQASSRPDKPPHILLYLIDDLGWADVGFHPFSNVSTPTLDSLASSGIELSRFYAQPVCSPSRAALMTGRFPFHIGMQHVTTLAPGTKAAIPLDQPTLAEMLSEAGYSTHAIGKWHLGYARHQNTPLGRGFDTHQGYYQAQCDYYTKLVNYSHAGRHYSGLDWWNNKESVSDESGIHNVELYTAAFERILDDYVASNTSAPLFTYYAQQMVHLPLESKEKWLENCGHIQNEDRRTYCGMLQAMDDALGQAIGSLKSRGMWEDTLLIVTSDNGGMPNYGQGFPSSAGLNYPLRAGKATLFEGGIRNVALVNGGDNVIPQSARGTVCKELLHLVDWFPTLAGLAGSSKLSSDLDGYDIWDVLMSGKSVPRASLPVNINNNVFYDTILVQSGIITSDNWKYLHQDDLTILYDGWYLPENMTTASNSTFIPPPENPNSGYFLFDLNTDPNEHNNLFSTQPEKVAELQSMLKGWTASYRIAQPNQPHKKSYPQFHDNIWAPFLPDTSIR